MKHSSFLLLLIFALALAWIAGADGADAVAPGARGARIALVIGNAKYEPSVGALQNPANDAKTMAKVLRTLGFTVIEKRNVSRDELSAAVLQFRAKARGAEVALFYFAGHGISVAGSNYLLPVRSGYEPGVAGGTDLRLLAETKLFNAEQVVAEMNRDGSGCNLVILDACRTTPAARDPRNRDAARAGGLAEMNPPAGSLVAFATDSGHTADDGQSGHGLYTEELVQQLLTPGLSIEQVFKRTRAGVMARSGGAQIPAEYSRLVGDDIVLLPRVAVAVPVAPVRPADAAGNATSKASVTTPSLKEIEKLASTGDTERVGEALQDYAKAHGADPKTAHALELLLEWVKTAMRDPQSAPAFAERALRACDLVLEILPTALPAGRAETAMLTAKAQNRRGDALLLLRKPEEALACYQAAAPLAPEDGYIIYNRGRAQLALGRRDEARKDFTTAAGAKFGRSGVRKLAQEALRNLPAAAKAQ